MPSRTVFVATTDLPRHGSGHLAPASPGRKPAGARLGRLTTLWQRLLRYRSKHGVAGTLHRIAQILFAHALRPLTLLVFFYPQVARDLVRWRLRRAPTVLNVIEGERRVPGGRFAVFVMWQPERTPWYVLNALQALAEVGANVVLVVNHRLEEQRLAELAPLCCRIIIRDNTGLDMGAYKDAVAHLGGEPIGRLLFLNDSIYYFAAGLPALFERLFSSQADLCASHENVQFSAHLQSFCLSVCGSLVRGDVFRRFWTRYVPVQSRRWAIHKGELGLSAALLPTAREVEVLYRAEDLASLNIEAGGIADPVPYLPLPQRLELETEPVSPLAGERLAGVLQRGSQIHTGGFLFRQLRGAPILKRDLVFRHQYTAEECRALLCATGHEDHLDEILDDLTRKGPPPAYGTLQHAKWATGLI